MKYLIASNRSFNKRSVTNPTELEEYVKAHPDIERIYFPFWSWKVPKDILDKFNCVGFHSAPLPKGRGGSPVQNMIRLGYAKTELCMFRMSDKFDGGNVIKRTDVSLRGNLSEILDRLRWVIGNMIDNVGSYNKCPSSDFENVPDTFKRITDNLLPERNNPREIYDEIRMRDAGDHPKTFLYHGKYIIEFTKAEFKEKDGVVTASVKIK